DVFARLLNAGTGPFDAVNYSGSRGASLVYTRHRMGRKLRRIIAALRAALQNATDRSLRLSTARPTRWEPFLSPTITLTGIHAYPTLLFDFHATQLSLPLDRQAHLA